MREIHYRFYDPSSSVIQHSLSRKKNKDTFIVTSWESVEVSTLAFISNIMEIFDFWAFSLFYYPKHKYHFDIFPLHPFFVPYANWDCAKTISKQFWHSATYTFSSTESFINNVFLFEYCLGLLSNWYKLFHQQDHKITEH